MANLPSIQPSPPSNPPQNEGKKGENKAEKRREERVNRAKKGQMRRMSVVMPRIRRGSERVGKI
jgi:hypothetical protein